MINLGTKRPGSTFDVPWSTFAGSTGASITSTGLAVGDVLVYKDAGMTQRASTSGFVLIDTDGIDLDAITGIQGFSISLADNTTAGFWAAGSRYYIVISSVTIDAQTVNFVAATFDIGYPDAVLNTTIATLSSQTSFTLTAGPAEDDALNGCVACIHDVASAVQLGFAVVLDYTGSTKTVTLTAGVTFTAAATDNVSVFPPAASRWSAATLEVATGTHLTAVPWNAAWDAEVQSEAQDAITASALATATNLATVAGYLDTEVQAIKDKTDLIPSDPADASVVAGLIAGLEAKLDTIDDFLDTEIGDLPTNAELATALGTADDAVLAAIAALNNLSAAAVNAEVDTALADYDAPTKAELDAAVATLALEASVGDLPTNAELATALGTADDAVLAQVALVKAKTDNLPSDPADQSLLIAATDAILTAVGDVPTNAELATALAAADDAVLVAIAALNNLSAAAVNAEVDTAIADAALATAAAVDAVDNLLDTEIGALTTALAAVKAITDALGAVAAAKLALTMSDEGVVPFTVETGTLTDTTCTTDLAEATDDHYLDRVALFLTGVLAGQVVPITGYTATGGILTYTNRTAESASDGDTGVIL